MKGVWIAGLNVIDSGVAVRPGEDVSGIDLELTNSAQQIGGTVTDAGGQPVPGHWVVLFSQDRDKWTNVNNRFFATVMTGPAGRFRVVSLPPGSYYAIATDQFDQNGNVVGMFSDPDFLEGAIRNATRFSLSDGSSTTVDLKVVAP